MPITSTIEAAIAALQLGRTIVLLDDAGLESGYLLCPAERCSAEQISQMANIGRGIVLAALGASRCEDLQLNQISGQSASGMDYTLSVEARHGISTGISSADRAATLRILARSDNPRADLVTPGHIFAVRAKQGGVLVRAAVPEAAVDLMVISKAPPAAVLCQCLDEHGEPLSLTDCQALATKASLPVTSLNEVIYHRLASETLIERVDEARLPLRTFDNFQAVCYRSKIDGAEHLALVQGDLDEKEENGLQKPIRTRVQAEQRLGDLLGLQPFSGRASIDASLKRISEHGRGVFVYIRHPRKGLLAKQLDALSNDTTAPVPKTVQLREYGIGAQILQDLGVRRLVLLSNSDREIPGIDAFQLEITGRERL